jgi:enediyne biosynthesis protein E4
MSRRLTRRLAVVTLFGIVALGAHSAPARERSGAQGAPHPSTPKTRVGDPDPQTNDPGAFSTGAEPRLKMPLPFSFTNIARAAGLDGTTVYGGASSNKYLLETTGTGVAAIDYDRDGRLDLFFVNGSRLEGFAPGQAPVNQVYRNKGDGTFEDVTVKTGLGASGWGQGACVGDYDNDGYDDLFVSYWGQNRLYHNRANGTFEDVTRRARLVNARTRWGTGCAFLDYDRDGRLDLFVANYIDLDLATAPTPDSGLCRYKGIQVACGPPGLSGGKNALYRNRGDGTFDDVSEKAGITRARGTYGLGVSTLDFDNDGWVDLYVANDSNPSALYRNNHDGTFTDAGVTSGCAYSQDGKPQAGMGVAVGDYDRNGTMDIFKTNFAGDTSTLYANAGDGLCEDRTFAAGIGVNTRWLGWGTGWIDLDNDGWLDLFLTNGHVYPEVVQLKTEAGYQQRKVVYRNLGNGRFSDLSERLGEPITVPKAGRGSAFADFDNDGHVDVAISNVNDRPDLYRLNDTSGHHWTTLTLVGTTSNRNAIGARVRCMTGTVTQWQEVRGGGSYLSQNDLRVHFGVGTATRIDRIDVRWPNGLEETWEHLPVDTFHVLKEGGGRASH